MCFLFGPKTGHVEMRLLAVAYPVVAQSQHQIKELIKANSRIIDLLCKRLDALENKLS